MRRKSPLFFLKFDLAMVFFLLCLLLTIWVRWRLLGIPLERDEGEYAYI